MNFKASLNFGEDQHRITNQKLADWPGLVRRLLEVKRAAALANEKAGLLTADEHQRIHRACDALKLESFTVDPYSGGGSILLNTQLNGLISESSGVETTRVNLSQSTADTVATALRLAGHDALESLGAQLEISVSMLSLLGEKLSVHPAMARTCLQDAMPTKLGILFTGAASVLARSSDRILNSKKSMLQVRLGSTVIGDGAGAAPAYQAAVIGALSNISGLNLTPSQSFPDAAQNADDWGAFNQNLELLAISLIKICKDQRLLASGPEHGFGEITLPQVIPGSSFFGPAKNNPTIPETVIQGCFLVLGRTRTALAALEHAELHLNVFESTAAFSALEAAKILENSLALWNSHCLPGISQGPKIQNAISNPSLNHGEKE